MRYRTLPVLFALFLSMVLFGAAPPNEDAISRSLLPWFEFHRKGFPLLADMERQLRSLLGTMRDEAGSGFEPEAPRLDNSKAITLPVAGGYRIWIPTHDGRLFLEADWFSSHPLLFFNVRSQAPNPVAILFSRIMEKRNSDNYVSRGRSSEVFNRLITAGLQDGARLAEVSLSGAKEGTHVMMAAGRGRPMPAYQVIPSEQPSTATAQNVMHYRFVFHFNRDVRVSVHEEIYSLCEVPALGPVTNPRRATALEIQATIILTDGGPVLVADKDFVETLHQGQFYDPAYLKQLFGAVFPKHTRFLVVFPSRPAVELDFPPECSALLDATRPR